MIASRVTSEQEYYDALRQRGFSATAERTDTGTFWKHADTGKHVLVPDSVQGFYPTWLTEDLEGHIKAITQIGPA